LVADLRCSVKLGEIGGLQRHNNTFLDYEFLCQPGLCLDTRKGATTEHCEDFFFRTVHLGTECWAFVALRGIDSAMGSAKAGRWHNAAAHLRAVAGILDYLGTHVCAPVSLSSHAAAFTTTRAPLNVSR
jgi:tryptophan 2,3-dioxygenase